jgi:hypothetical protein
MTHLSVRGWPQVARAAARSKTRSVVDRDFGMADAQLRVGQPVRLLRELQGLPAGTVGNILGFYGRTKRTVLVRFDEATVEVESSALERVDVSG